MAWPAACETEISFLIDVACSLFPFLRHVVGPTEQRSGRGGPVPWLGNPIRSREEADEAQHLSWTGHPFAFFSFLFCLVLIYSTVGTWLFEESFSTKHTAHITRQHRNDQRSAGGSGRGSTRCAPLQRIRGASRRWLTTLCRYMVGNSST